MLGIEKLNSFVALFLGKFLLFDRFQDLANFQEIDNFLVFGSANFLINLSPLSTLSNLLITNILDDIVIFSIDVSSTTILLKPQMNY